MAQGIEHCASASQLYPRPPLSLTMPLAHACGRGGKGPGPAAWGAGFGGAAGGHWLIEVMALVIHVLHISMI